MRVLLLLSLIFLSGCVQATTVIEPLNKDAKGIIDVQNIYVTYNEFAKTSILKLDAEAKERGVKSDDPEEIQYQSLKTSLEKVAKEHLEQRDGDSSVYADISIEISNFKLVNPMAAILVGDSDQLTGTVKVYDTKTKKLYTEFYVDVLKGSGGLLGLAIRGGGVREKLGLNFAKHIGDELGYREVE